LTLPRSIVAALDDHLMSFSRQIRWRSFSQLPKAAHCVRRTGGGVSGLRPLRRLVEASRRAGLRYGVRDPARSYRTDAARVADHVVGMSAW
jgi:hypothetical protein